ATRAPMPKMVAMLTVTIGTYLTAKPSNVCNNTIRWNLWLCRTARICAGIAERTTPVAALSTAASIAATGGRAAGEMGDEPARAADRRYSSIACEDRPVGGPKR